MKTIEDLKRVIAATQIEGHFEVGKQFHSETYINLKFYFSDYKVLKLLSKAVIERLNTDINPKKAPTTFIGFRSYVGNLLSLICEHTPINNYYIIESENEKLIWQINPEKEKIQSNIIVLLPVSCTSSYIFKIKDFLNTNFPDKTFDKFINVFMIFDEIYKNPIDYNLPKVSNHLYKQFNWSKIDKAKTIYIHQNDDDILGLMGFTIVDVYTKLNLKHECQLCFPEAPENEKLLHPYHSSFESTKLLNGYPSYVYKSKIKEIEREEIIFNKSNAKDFKKLFFGTEKIHFYGNIKSRSGTYNHFINGNVFYKKNKKEILEKFSKKLFSISKNYDKIVFVTAEGTNNSSFLEDLLPIIENNIKDVSILRFTSDHEFIDSFINNHKDVLIDKTSEDRKHLLIYFEEIMSGTGTFKLLSNYIKHYCAYNESVDENEYKKHGFDYIFTLIDRTSANIESEVLKKLYSKRNTIPEEHFIKFFELNAPVFNTPHMGNPIENEEIIINNIKNTSNLDALKKYIIDTELTPKKIFLPEDFYKPEDNTKYEQLQIKKSEYNLIKLYCTDKIYEKLSMLDEESKFDLEIIFDELIEDNYKVNFIKNAYDSERLLKDIVLKILTKHPFIHYKNICESALKYCLTEIKINIEGLQDANKDDKELYYMFWSLRFYIKRLIELNSKFIISDYFFNFLYEFYSESGSYSKLFDITKDIEHLNTDYHKNQVQSFSAFLLYCFKRLIYDDFGTSIKLEKLLIKNNFLIKSSINKISDKNIVPIFQNSYFKFLDMLTLENIYPFQKIIENIGLINENEYYKSFIFHNYDEFNIDNQLNKIEYKYYENQESQDELMNMTLYDLTKRFLSMIKNESPINSSISLLYEYQSQNEDYYYHYKLTDEENNIGSNIRLGEKSFAKQFIKGITKNNKVQSFYTIIKTNNEYHTFTKHYEYNNNPECSFDESIKNDLDIINEEDSILLYLRLSEIYSIPETEINNFDTRNNTKDDVRGNGVIIISFKLSDLNTIFDFIDSRKLRNLLFIRNFFLKNLKSKFEAQNFIEILEQIKIKDVRSKFNHGIDTLQKKFLNFLHNSDDIDDCKKLSYPFEQIYSQIELLISYKDISEDDRFSTEYNLRPKIINEIFDIYMKLIDSENAEQISMIKLDNQIFDSIKIPLIIKQITLPEIFYNIRKVIYGQNLIKEFKAVTISISLSQDKKFLVIENPFIPQEDHSFSKINGGMDMNNKIMEALQFAPVSCLPNEDCTVVTTKIQISK